MVLFSGAVFVMVAGIIRAAVILEVGDRSPMNSFPPFHCLPVAGLTDNSLGGP